jgi:hypothetical protein
LAPHRHRRAVAMRLMKAHGVVKIDPLTDTGPRFGGQLCMINDLS